MGPKLNNLFIIPFMILYSTMSFAQDGKTPPAPVKASGTPPPGLVLPIDDNVWVLVAAGLILGVYFTKKGISKTSGS